MSRKPTTFSVRIHVSDRNKTSLTDTNIAMDLPYGVDFVSVKRPNPTKIDIEIDELANTIYFLKSPFTNSKRGLSYTIKVSLKLGSPEN